MNIQVIDDGENLIGTKKDLKEYLRKELFKQFDNLNLPFPDDDFENVLHNAKSIYEALYENDDFIAGDFDDYYKINYDNNFQELFVTKIN